MMSTATNNAIRLSSKTLRNERIVLGPVTSDAHSMGPMVTLEECTVDIAVAAKSLFFIAPMDWKDCNIHAIRQLTNFQDWWNVKLIRCKFHGHFRGNTFGHRKSNPAWKSSGEMERYGLKEREPCTYGDVVDCDFADATLDLCQMVNVDIDRIVLPSWPHITWLNPKDLRDKAQAVTIPKSISFHMDVLSQNDEQVTAVIDNTSVSIRRGDYTEEDILEALKRLPTRCYRIA